MRLMSNHRWGARGWGAVAGMWLAAGGAQIVCGSTQFGVGAIVLAGFFGLVAARSLPRSTSDA